MTRERRRSAKERPATSTSLDEFARRGGRPVRARSGFLSVLLEAAGPASCFEEITRRESIIRPARTAILAQHARSMVEQAGSKAVLFEFGLRLEPQDGARALRPCKLSRLRPPPHQPIDVSRPQLTEDVVRLSRRFRRLEIMDCQCQIPATRCGCRARRDRIMPSSVLFPALDDGKTSIRPDARPPASPHFGPSARPRTRA